MIRIENISFGYGRNKLFDDFSLTIPSGQCCLVTGVNGMGKSTLLRLMAGALRPDNGRILYPSLPHPKKKTVLISDSLSLFENISVKQMVELHRSIYHLGRINLELVSRVKIDPKALINTLSAGQRTILLLDLMLSIDPAILLIDEVLPALDAFMRTLFLETIMYHRQKRKMTIVTVNLNFHDIEKLVDRVVLLKTGRIQADESISELKSKVRRIRSNTRPERQTILYSEPTEEAEETTDYYVYPYCDEGDAPAQTLSLTEIIRAFIGAAYV